MCYVCVIYPREGAQQKVFFLAFVLEQTLNVLAATGAMLDILVSGVLYLYITTGQ